MTSVALPPAPVPPRLSVATGAAAAVLTATTHVFLAATSTQKRARPASLREAFISLPPLVPGMAGHREVGAQWVKVVVMCRRALIDLGDESPRYLELHRDGNPSPSHLSLKDAVYRDRLQTSDWDGGHYDLRMAVTLNVMFLS